jgi:hypothetical protein
MRRQNGGGVDDGIAAQRRFFAQALSTQVAGRPKVGSTV